MRLKFIGAAAIFIATAACTGAAQAACSVTYSFTSGTTAVASQINTNFSDLYTCAAPLASPSFTGNVGIGTVSPSTRLVVGAGTSNEAITVNAGSGWADLILKAASTTGGNIYWNNGTTNEGGIFYYLGPGGHYMSFTTNSSERLRIDSSGNVGIGTSTATYPLSIGDASTIVTLADPTKIALGASYGTSAVGKNFKIRIFDVTSSPTLTYGLGVSAALFELTAASDADFAFFKNGTTPTELVRIKGSGNVGIGTASPGQKLDVSGTIRQSGCTTAGTLSVNSSGDIICTSDARLKNIVGDYKDGLNAVLRITPSRFSYKPTPSNPNEEFIHAGFIAQDVKMAIPQAVALQRGGFYSLDTTAILAASVNAIKELKAANDNQAAKIERLEMDVAMLRRRLQVQAAAK